MPPRVSAKQKLVDACLRAPLPTEVIEAPPKEVMAAAKAYATLDEAQRLAVIPQLVRWLGVEHDWPALSFEELCVFTDAAREAKRSRFLPVTVAMLFGANDGQIPRKVTSTSLDAFNRGLAIMKTKRFWSGGSPPYKKAVEAVPSFPDAGPENERIVACFLDVETSEDRSVLIPFVLKNERWEIFDALEAGFKKGRGELKTGDTVYAARFPLQRDAFASILERLGAAALKGREVLQPIWDADAEVTEQAKERFERAPLIKKRFGKSVWWGPARSKSTSPDDVAMTLQLTRKVKDVFETLGTLVFAARRKPGKPWTFTRLTVQLNDETIELG